MSTKRFLGYDTDETGKLVINRKQAPIVVRLYQEFLDGKTTDYIKRILKEGVRNWDGGTKWHPTTLMSMLENEKYKGDTYCREKLHGGFPLPRNGRRIQAKFRCIMWKMTTISIISKRIWGAYSLK